MLRVFGRISLFGTKEIIDVIASYVSHLPGEVVQVGLKRNVPETNRWCWESPLYRFDLDDMDNDVRSFVMAYAPLGVAIEESGQGLTHAFLTLCPVEQSAEELFACVLGVDTVRAISGLGIGIQISPASVMPDASFWGKRRD